MNPLNKDAIFLCNSSRRVTQLYKLARRYQRYIVTVSGNSIPEAAEGEILAPLEGFAWTPKGRFFVSTKSGTHLICGNTGNLLFSWKSFFAPDQEDKRLAHSYITNMMFIRSYFVAVHEARRPDQPPKQYLVLPKDFDKIID